MQKLALLTSIALLTLSTAAHAGPDDVPAKKDRSHHGESYGGKGHHGMHDPNIASMTPEQRKAYFAERKAQWEKMSDAEKVKIIETKRAERLKAMEAEWQGMSDAEKIKHVEKRMKHKYGGKGKHCDKDGGGKGDHSAGKHAQ